MAGVGRVAASRQVAQGLYELEVDLAGTELAAGYTRPGQFVTLSTGGLKPGFFAIASPPGVGERLEFLVKRSGETAEALCALSAGDPVEVSAVMGKGFPLERAEGRDLLIFATGSGISAVRPVIEHARHDGRQVHLFYGALSSDWMAWTERFPHWEARGVTVHTTLDNEPAERGYTGFAGFVQDLYLAKAPLVDPAEAAAVLCGLPGMVKAVTALLTEQGMPAERVLLNF